MKAEDLYALQITSQDYFDYQTRKHSIETLIVADKLYDKSFLKWWICHWLEEPTTPLDKLPLCVENEIRLRPDYYTAHVEYCVNNNLLDILRTTWVPEAVPKDIMNAVKMFEINMFTVNFLIEQGFPPTEKIFLHAVMNSDIGLLKICFGHGWTINQTLGEYTPLEWCVGYGCLESVDTCFLYGAKITSRAVQLSFSRNEDFFQRLGEDYAFTSLDLKNLVEASFHALRYTGKLDMRYHAMFQEMYTRRVEAGEFYAYILAVRMSTRYQPFQADLSLFC